MPLKFFTLTLFLFVQLACQSQDINLGQYINAFTTTGIQQSLKAQAIYDTLSTKLTAENFQKITQALYEYEKANSNKRLKVRIMMYDALGQRHFNLPPGEKRAALAMQAIKLAYPLKDEQLNAELYALYGDMIVTIYDYLFYNLKALEIQRKIGFEHFAYLQNRFFGISTGLYRTGDYNYSIKYAKEGLLLQDMDQPHWDRNIYVAQLDILGANYRRLKKYDSVYFYYNEILRSIKSHPHKDPLYNKLWTGIANGNIGLVLAKQNNFGQAIPLLKEYLQTAIDTKDLFNIVLAGNNLADYFYHTGDHAMALQYWKKSLQLTDDLIVGDELLEALKGVHTIYKQDGMMDSSLHYMDLYYQLKKTIDSNSRTGSYATAARQMAFDNLQFNFERTEFAYMKERRTRNAILAGIVLLTIIALLLHNRRSLQEKIRYNNMLQKQQAAAKEVMDAKNKIEEFTLSVIEKDKLIISLQEQISSNATPGEIPESLLQYTLLTEEAWHRFKKEFATVYPCFFTSLYQKLSPCSHAEERLACLLFLQLNNRQISTTLGISPASVSRACHRLRTRLQLGSDGELKQYISNLM